MRKLLPVISFIISGVLYCQSSNESDVGRNLSKISPPTPESYKFGTFGNLPIGLFTGATNFSIPLTTFTLKDISIPLSLNYSSNGIKLDDLNGSVGLGWTFINAGVITRIIRDEADELNGFINGDVPDINALGFNHPTVINYLNSVSTDGVDSEPDLFMANFAGRNLKFVVDKNGNSIQLDKTSCKINGYGSLITTEDGTKYFFDAQEQVKNSMTNVGMHGPVKINTTSWYLTKIITKSGQEIHIQYYDKTYTSTIAQSQSLSYTIIGPQQFKYGPINNDNIGSGSCDRNCDVLPFSMTPNIGLVSKSEQNIIVGKQIKKIYDQNGNTIQFIYEEQVNDVNRLVGIQKFNSSNLVEDLELKYLISPNNRVFLTEVLNKKSQSRHSFEYYNPTELPEKLSFKRDMWGYYNAKDNINIIPQIFNANSIGAVQYNGADQTVNENVGYYGLLKKIVYPTGGSSEILYENHKIRENTIVPGHMAVSGLQTSNDNFTNTSTEEQIIIPKKTGHISIMIGANTNESCTNNSFPTDRMKADLSVSNTLTDEKLNILKKGIIGYNPQGIRYTASHGVYEEVFVYVEKDIPYKISLSARWFCSNAYANVKYQSTEDFYVLQDKLLGGYRVKSISDNPSSGNSITKNYQYLLSNGNHSLIQVVEPYFKEIRHTKSVCNNVCQAPIENTFHTMTSSSLSQYNGGQPNICYTQVSEKFVGGEGNGKIVHHFQVSSDGQGAVFGDYISGTPWSNEAWDNGKEILTEYVDNHNDLLKTIEYNYKKNYDSNLFGLSVRKKYDQIITSANQANFDHLDLVFYKNISRFISLSSQKTTEYLGGIPIVTEVEYFYDNPHYQLTKQVATHSDSKITETTYQYAHEKNNSQLVNANMIGIPLEVEVKKQGKILSKTETKYDNPTIPLPSSVLSYDALSGTSSIDVTYDKYDTKGNLLQYTTKAGIPTAIIWGYNNTQPIAKVNGATYDQLNGLGLISAIVSASDSDALSSATEPVFITALDNFRKNASLSGIQITTYTYDPLIGVTSITPPSGLREIYLYDSANRLKEIRQMETDSSGNITYKTVKEFKYNYKN